MLLFCLTAFVFSQESIEKTLKLFQGYKMISDILLERTGAQGGGGGGSGKRGGGVSMTIKSNLTLQSILKLLQAVFKLVVSESVRVLVDVLIFHSDSSPNHQQSLKILRECRPFLKYIVTAAVQKIHHVS